MKILVQVLFITFKYQFLMLIFFSNAQTIITADNKADILIMQANILPNEIDKSPILERDLKYSIYVSICYQSLQI